MHFEIVPFAPDLLADAGALLAHRHAANRAAIPLLPGRFSEPAVAANAIKAALARPHASGVAAVADGRLLGYLVGDMVFDTTWGRAAWVRLPGYALAHDRASNCCATCTRRWGGAGWPLAATPTSRSFPRPNLPCSTPGSG